MEERTKTVRTFVAALLLASASRVGGEVFTVPTPAGSIQVDITHTGPEGSLVSPVPPEPAAFRPPTIFSAPLPSGSGARALALSGAFTAVADDATAASWNPAGLTQLEYPEVSAVYRFSRRENEHTSGDSGFTAGSDHFRNDALNYFSLSWPFSLGKRRVVCSFNYQEAYDFTQELEARTMQSTTRSIEQTTTDVFEETEYDHAANEHADIDIVSHFTTRVRSSLSQLLSSDLLTDLSFKQEGVIDAFSPAVALELTPRLALGATLNIYGDNMLGRDPIRSRTKAAYSGNASSIYHIEDERTTKGTYTYSGTLEVGGAHFPVTIIDIPEKTGDYPDLDEEETTDYATDLRVQGTYEEVNEFTDLNGVNATFGLLWVASRHLSFGFVVDLPWTAHADQTRKTTHHATTYDASGRQLLDETSSTSVEKRDVEFEFPLYWSAGTVWRFNDRFYASLDLSRTYWSEFSFKADGEQRLNPLDGSLDGEHPIEDCWSVRYGMEYLCMFNWTEIPLRSGVFWEQRPAVGEPDEYWGFSLGSGISLGKDPHKVILDVAYVYTQGNDVMGSLVPDARDLHTDFTEHQLFVSSILHF